MRTLSLALLLFAAGCTDLGTRIEVSGDARAIRYLFYGGELPPSDNPVIKLCYETTADKSIVLHKENGTIEFSSMSDSSLAEQARQRDSAVAQQLLQQIVNLLPLIEGAAGAQP